jgi:hypothetical protein
MSTVAGMMPGIPAPAPVPAQKTFFDKYIKEGIPVPKSVTWPLLLFFAGVIPFVPFSYLGYAGVNLMVTGSMGWGLVKAVAQLVFSVVGQLSTQAFPDLWILPWLFMYNPWYLFDIIQLFNPNFNKVDEKGRGGFKIPFVQRKIGVPNAKVSIPVMGLIIMILCAGLYHFLDFIPGTIATTVKPVMQTVLAIIGGGTALVGSSVGAITMGPALINNLKGGSSGLEMLGVSAAPAVAPVAAVAPAAFAPVAAAPVVAAPIAPVVAPAPVAPVFAPAPVAPVVVPPMVTSYVTGPVETVTGPVTGPVESVTGPVTGPLTGPVTGPLESVTGPVENASGPLDAPFAQGGGGVDLDAIARNLIEDTSVGIGAYLLVGSLAVVAIGGAAVASVRP